LKIDAISVGDQPKRRPAAMVGEFRRFDFTPDRMTRARWWGTKSAVSHPHRTLKVHSRLNGGRQEGGATSASMSLLLPAKFIIGIQWSGFSPREKGVDWRTSPAGRSPLLPGESV
jgi:hypothetical protein